MKITRDGNSYELTANERYLAYHEELMAKWLGEIESAIERNEDCLIFDEEFTREEFVSECLECTGELFADDEIEEKFDEIIFNTAEFHNCWKENR